MSWTPIQDSGGGQGVYSTPVHMPVGTFCVESMVSISYPGQSCPVQSGFSKVHNVGPTTQDKNLKITFPDCNGHDYTSITD